MTEASAPTRGSRTREERGSGGPAKRTKRKKRHAAAVSRVAATGAAATATAVLVTLMGVQGRASGSSAADRTSGWSGDTAQDPGITLDRSGTAIATDLGVPAPVVSVPQMTPPVTRSSES